MVGYRTVAVAVRRTSFEPTRITRTSGRLVVSIDSQDGVEAEECAVTANHLRSVLNLKLLLFDGIEVTSTEFNRKAHAGLKELCCKKVTTTPLVTWCTPKRKTGILRVSINSHGLRLLQLFVVRQKAISVSKAVAVGLSIKLFGLKHITTNGQQNDYPN